MLADVAPYLCCPLCRADLTLSDQAGSAQTLGCEQGHRFDVARQGYASLLAGDAHTGTADTAEMVAARADFLAGGEFAALTEAVADATQHAVPDLPGCLVDAGGGTGHYLAAALDRCPDHVGISCDLSRYAARRAARAHPRMGAVVADVWRGLPVRDTSAAVVLNVFAPRNAAEFHRALHPEGALVVATPQPDHLSEVVGRLGLVSVDEDKDRRLSRALDERFVLEHSRSVRWTMRLDAAGVRALVEMGPSARHTDDLDAETLAALAPPGDPMGVTGAVTVATYRPRHVP
ncbi:MAG: putative RNA methyltransferase [Nocardioidaceae bacterium]